MPVYEKKGFWVGIFIIKQEYTEARSVINVMQIYVLYLHNANKWRIFYTLILFFCVEKWCLGFN